MFVYWNALSHSVENIPMSRSKRVLVLPLVFVVAVVISFFIQTPFARMVRYFYQLATHNKLYFTGKYFRLFPSDAFILSFGGFCVVLTTLLFRHAFKQALYRTALVLALFFVSVASISAFNAQTRLTECTACKDGRRAMSARELKYDAVFIAGQVIALLPLVAAEVVYWRRKKPRVRGFQQSLLV